MSFMAPLGRERADAFWHGVADGVEGPADPRLDMFRDFINSLEVDPGAGGESGGRRS